MHDPEAISVLVIEDSRDLAANIADELEARGYLLHHKKTRSSGFFRAPGTGALLEVKALP